MKRIFLTAAGLFALLHSYSQSATDSTGFKSRKLKIEEMNLVSSYYQQEGDHAAVTGGIGSQKLTDFANVFDIKLVRYDKKSRKNSYNFEMGFDNYTSASSDMVDLKANSSASHQDTRFYPSVNWTRENDVKGSTIGLGFSSSTEFDYQSFGGNISIGKKTKDRSGEFTARFQAYFDQVTLIAPVELRTIDNGSTSPRNTFAAAFTYSQIVNDRLQIMLLADIARQDGYLSLPFHRVYFKDGSVHQEKLPDTRLKIPIGLRANYFLGDKFIVRTYYRFYKDDWDLISHTADIEIPYKVTPFFSVSPFYRFYMQSAINSFAGYMEHTHEDQYYTSNYDLSKFHSDMLGVGVRIAPPKGILGIKNLSMLELRYGYYLQSTDLNANIISIHIKYK